jgi:hypothetical protein
MKTKINFLDKNKVEKELEDLKHVDFSLFIESQPQHYTELSSINVLSLYEPNEYFGFHDLAIKDKDTYDIILTWDDKVLKKCDNAVFLPFGHTWLQPDQFEKQNEKKFELAHLCGTLLKSYGHSMRHEIMARTDEFEIPTNFYPTIGERHDLENARLGKETVLANSQYGVAIENFSHRNFFTEKILDCFLLKTIPLYWGCSNIDEFFNPEGIIKFENIDDLIYKVNQLDENFYESKKEVIEENWKLALKYVNYEKNIADKLKEIFKLNNLL